MVLFASATCWDEGSEFWLKKTFSLVLFLKSQPQTYHQHAKVSQVIAFANKFPSFHIRQFFVKPASTVAPVASAGIFYTKKKLLLWLYNNN